MADDFIDISKLAPRTSAVGSDLLHTRKGGIDNKISVEDFMGSLSIDINTSENLNTDKLLLSGESRTSRLKAARVSASAVATLTQLGIDFGPGIWRLKPNICGMSKTVTTYRIAYIDEFNDLLAMFEFDKLTNTWSQIGNSLLITPCTEPKVCRMNDTRLALTNTTGRTVGAYDFDGTDWSLTGSLFAAFAGSGPIHPASRTGDTIGLNYYDGVDARNAVYFFNGSVWAIIGVTFDIGATANPCQWLNINILVVRNRAYYYREDGTWQDLGDVLVSNNFGSSWEFLGKDLLVTTLGNVVTIATSGGPLVIGDIGTTATRPVVTVLDYKTFAIVDEENGLKVFEIAVGEEPSTLAFYDV